MSAKTALVFLICAGFAFGCTESVPTESAADQEIVFSDDAAVFAKKPLVIELTSSFVGGTPPDEPTWIANITIDGNPYVMAFFSVGNGKPFDVHPQHFVKLLFFEEIWRIYDGPWDDPGSQVLMEGHANGVMTLSNMHFISNGMVEVAEAPFAMWLGRKVHSDGFVSWPDFPLGIPLTAEGIVRFH